MTDHEDLLAQIEERRGDVAFMERLRERMAADGPMLDRMAAKVREQTWDVLAGALSEIVYTRDAPPGGRRFHLERDDAGNWARLSIFTYNPNTYDPESMRHTRHEFIVPVATYHKASWTRWVFDRIASIEHHETCESFQVLSGDIESEDECAKCFHTATAHDGRDSTCFGCAESDAHRFVALNPRRYRPYAPHHGNGWSPYQPWYGGYPIEQAKAPGED